MRSRAMMKPDDSEPVVVSEKKTMELCTSVHDGLRCLLAANHDGPHLCDLSLRDNKVAWPRE